MSQASAEAAARTLLTKARISAPPVDVEVLATVVGAVVQRRPNSPDISGLLYLNGSDVLIGVNADESLVRQRFTIAHEIGHLQLHKKNGTFFVDRTYRAASKHSDVPADATQEREANWFAAELLMPQEMVVTVAQGLLDKRSLTDEALAARLAERFQVSRQAMGYRLLNLGLVNSL